MRDIPRDAFVPDHLSEFAHGIAPLPIGEGQAISRSYIVALMTQLLGLSGKGRVLVTAAVLCVLSLRLSGGELRDLLQTFQPPCGPWCNPVQFIPNAPKLLTMRHTYAGSQPVRLQAGHPQAIKIDYLGSRTPNSPDPSNRPEGDPYGCVAQVDRESE